MAFRPDYNSTPLSVRRNINFTDGEKSHSRKRKCISNILQEPSLNSESMSLTFDTGNDSSIPNLVVPKSGYETNSSRHTILSFQDSGIGSTVEDVKLTSSFENVHLHSINEDIESAEKKFKWDNETVSHSRKSISAPGTPKHDDSDREVYMKKYRSLEFTPTKPTYTKIGTPERNEILYPQIAEVKPATKPKSPQKLRNELKRLNEKSKPARKRLFKYVDFIRLFAIEQNHREIIHKIFAYLNDSDLVSISKVSSTWRKILQDDNDSFKRYKNYVAMTNICKENIPFSTFISDKSKSSITCNTTSSSFLQVSTASETWKRFVSMATNLPKSQRLMKCCICVSPAVLVEKVVQCTNRNCSYIWCDKCKSASTTGPQDFLCKCDETNPTSSPCCRSSLANISNVNFDGFKFFKAESPVKVNPNINIPGETYTLPVNQTKINKKSTALTVWNKNLTSANKRRDEEPLPNFKVIAEQCMRQQLPKTIPNEPNSPPKVAMTTIGSERSKKNLRRLFR